MKTKKFKFQQVVITEVKTQFDYEIKEKSFEEAEKKFKKLFEAKAEEGIGHMPLKKLKPKKHIVEIVPVSPEDAGYSTITVDFIKNKKKNIIRQELYNNTSKTWVSLAGEPKDTMIEKNSSGKNETEIEEAE